MCAKKKAVESEEVSLDIYNKNITESDAGEYIKEVVMRYGINVSVFRACSAILDGLTPVKRRMLYTFYKAGAYNDKRRVKANELLGPVQALHPHGELSINKSFTNEIKSWENNAPLFDTHGNCGSLTGQPAAAVRYLETRLSKFTMKCFFDDFDPDITDMVESNTRRTKEPVTIPAKYPYFLLSLNTGIGWGNSMSIPPFNLTEVLRLTQALLRNPQMTNVYLYPDSPRGYSIIENDDIGQICDTGRGTLKIQAQMKYHETEDGKRYISVKGFPEQTYMDNIMKQIVQLTRTKKITGISTLRDNTSLDNVEFWVMLTPDADPEFVMDVLYKKTSLRSHILIDMNFAGRTNMQPLGLKPALLFWIDNRIDVKQKFLIKKLSRTKERIHTVEGIIDALSPNKVERTVEIIKNATDDADSINKLVAEYGLTTYQASIINDTKLSRINKNSQQKFIEEREVLLKEVKNLESYVTSREKIKDIIYEELEEGIKLFGKPRQCSIIGSEVLETPTHRYSVVVTKKYIKKMSVNATTIGQLDSSDEVIGIWRDVPETATLRLIDDIGKCYCIGIDKINPSDAVSKGTTLNTFGVIGVPVKGFFDDKIDNFEDYSLVLFTTNGFIKRTSLDQYSKSRMSLQAINLNKGDKICYMSIIRNDMSDNSVTDFPLIYTANGQGIAIKLGDIQMTDRMTKGLRHLALDDGDVVQGICEPEDNGKVIVITTKGMAKICAVDDIFKTTKRKASMIRITALGAGDTVYKIIPVTEDINKITYYMQSGEHGSIQLSDIKETTRVSKGLKTIPVKRGDSIIRLKY